MRVVLVGDIGWSDLYHLGDEAMTERALEALRERGVTDVTLVAGDPEHASARYGVPAVPRIGFRARQHRAANAARRRTVLEALRSPSVLPPHDPAHRVIEAVRGADAVLVAGGGNLTSFFPQHVFERTTLYALARELGTPFALTSQTVGPLLTREDEAELRPMLAGAVAFGAREPATAALVDRITAGAAAVVRTTDDAFALTATADDAASVDQVLGSAVDGRGPVIASFAENPSTPVIGRDAYYELAARAAADLADQHDAEVLLVPHAGNPSGAPARDQVSDATIARLAAHPRVRATPLLTARQLAALTARARLVVGTRYHPGIFAAGAAVPSVALAPTLYSSVRMRGAATNVGMPDHVLGLESWRSGDLLTAARELQDDDAGVRAHLSAVVRLRRAEHDRWWDALVGALRTGERAERVELATVEPYRSPGAWAVPAAHLLDATERYDRARIEARWHREHLENRISRLERAAASPPRTASSAKIPATAKSDRVTPFAGARGYVEVMARRLVAARRG